MKEGQTERRLLRKPAVLERTGLAARTLYEEISQGRFPRPVPISSRCVAWDSAGVERWVEERIAAAESGKAA